MTSRDVQPNGAEQVAGAASDIRGFLADGASLGASAMFTALIGLVGWLLAARMLDPADVGRASAFVSGFLLVAGLAELGLSQAVLRWLPPAGGHAPAMVRWIYLGSIAVCVLIGTTYAVVAAVHLPGPLGDAPVRAVFVLSAVVWMLFHLQDYVITGVGAARWVPLENITFGVVRVVLLVVLAKALGALGIVLSWTVSTTVWVVGVTVLLALNAPRVAGRPGVVPGQREAVLTAGSVYLSTLGQTMLSYAVPIIVINRYGPTLGAVFSIVWLGLNALDFAALGFGNALVVRLRGGSLHLLRSAAGRVVPIFAVALVVAALLAGPLLHLFGPTYADQGDTLLRLAVLGALFRVPFTLISSIHLARGRAPRMALLHWTTALVLIGVVSLAPESRGLAFLGAGYAVAQALLLALAVADLVRVSRREGTAEPVPSAG